MGFQLGSWILGHVLAVDFLDITLPDAFQPGHIQVLDSLGVEGNSSTKQGTLSSWEYPVDRHPDEKG